MPARSSFGSSSADVAQFGQLWVAEHGVVVEADLGVEGEEVAGFGDDERVDFDEAAIERDEQLAEGLHELLGRANARAGELKLGGELADLVRLQAGVGAERFFENQLGRFLGDVFDVHAAGAAGHEDGQARGAVDDDAEVKLAGDVAAGFDEDAADGLAFGAGLDGDELVFEKIPAAEAASSAERTSWTPCCFGLSLMVPLPRPPAWICALTTASGPAELLNAAVASSAVVAMMPAGTATPASRRSCLAWYSWIFIRAIAAVEK